jgi:hypothetical protein
MKAGDTLASATVTIDADDDDGQLTLGSVTFDATNRIALCRITGGTVGNTYCLECIGVTTNGNTLNVLGQIRVVDQCE